MYPPPPGMQKLKYQVKVKFWFWLMYPPGIKISGQSYILVFWLMYPPPRNGKVEISGQSDILVLADVPLPPPGIEKLKSQVKVKFWFWLMYPPVMKISGQSDILVFWLMYPPPPRNGKVEISGQSDILVLADVPPQKLTLD